MWQFGFFGGGGEFRGCKAGGVGRVVIKNFFFRIGSKSNFVNLGNFGVGRGLGGGWTGVGRGVNHFFCHESSSWVEIRLHTEFGRVWLWMS